MEKVSLQVAHYTDEPKFPGSLRRADEICEKLNFDIDRLKELTDALYVPHYRVAGGEPLYGLDEVKKWVAKNCLERIDGKDLPITLQVLVQPKPTANIPPKSIINIEGLYELPVNASPPGVYFLVKKNKVVYVGQSVNPIARITNHTDKDFDAAWMLPVPRSMLNAVEGAFIRALNPPLNSGDRDVAIGPGDRVDDEFVLRKFAKGLEVY